MAAGRAPAYLGVRLGKGRPLGERRRPDRATQALGEGYARFPALTSGDVRAVDQDGPVRPVDGGGELGEALRIGRDALADGACGNRLLEWLVPVVQRQREKHRTGGRLKRDGVGAHEGGRDVLGARGFIAPLDPGTGHDGGVHVGQKRLQQRHVAGLLPRGDDERRLVLIRREQAPHGVAKASGGVHIDEGGLAGRLGVAVGEPHGAGFLERQDVGEVAGEVLKKCFFGRARVAEDRGQAEVAHQIARRVADCEHFATRR